MLEDERGVEHAQRVAAEAPALRFEERMRRQQTAGVAVGLYERDRARSGGQAGGCGAFERGISERFAGQIETEYGGVGFRGCGVGDRHMQLRWRGHGGDRGRGEGSI